MTTCLVCNEPMTIVGEIRVHPTCEVDPNVSVTDIYTIITDSITNMPRSQQKRIGPSEIGHPCDRRIGHKLAGTPEVNARGVAWKPYVGTAIHEQMADLFAKHEIARFGDGSDDTVSPRWHVEERVTVGEIDGTPIVGSCDLFDSAYGVVHDHKFTSKNQIVRNYRPKGPGSQYRVQAHLYGRGFARQGYDVRHVSILFATRDGEYSDRYVWTEPYDEQVAIDGLERVAGIKGAIDILGPEVAIPTLPMVASYCSNCPFYKTGASVTDARSCPGVEDSVRGARTDNFADLLVAT